MKKHLLITICLAVFCALATRGSAPKYVDIATGSLTETPPQQKAFIRSADVSETSASVSYTFNHVRLVPDGKEGEYAVTVPGFGRFSDPAGWSLPLYNEIIDIPDGCDAVVTPVCGEYIDIPLRVSHPVLWFGERKIENKDLPAAKVRAQFPAAPAAEIETQVTRGSRSVVCRISPVQYLPQQQAIRVWRTAGVDVAFTPSDSEPTRHKQVRQTYADAHEAIAESRGMSKAPGMPGSTFITAPTYLILTHSDLSSAALQLAEWKKKMGYNVEIKTVDGWSSTKIKQFIYNRYPKAPYIYYLTILGGHKLVPAQILKRDVVGETYIFASDYYYTCNDDVTDKTSDLDYGRIPAENLQEAIIAVSKIISYESNPTKDPTFYDNFAAVGCFEYNQLGYESGGTFFGNAMIAKEYMESQGKHSNMYFSKWGDSLVKPLKWYNPMTHEYIPLSEEYSLDLPSSWRNDVFNNNLFVFYNAHGMTYGWGRPELNINHVDNLKNKVLPIVFNLSCSTGNFSRDVVYWWDPNAENLEFRDNSKKDCMAERLLYQRGGGAVGVIAATCPAYASYTSTLYRTIVNNLYPEPGLNLSSHRGDSVYSTGFKSIGQLGKLTRLSLKDLDKVTNLASDKVLFAKEQYQCFGDPTMMIHTSLPKPIPYTVVDVSPTTKRIESREYVRFATYNKRTNQVKHLYGKKAEVNVSSADDWGNMIFSLTGQNLYPVVSGFTGYGTASDNKSEILDIRQRGSELEVDYTIENSDYQGVIFAISVTTGEMISTSCEPGTGTAILTMPESMQGVCAVILKEKGDIADSKKTLIRAR